MKRILSVILTVILLFSFSVAAMAGTDVYTVDKRQRGKLDANNETALIKVNGGDTIKKNYDGRAQVWLTSLKDDTNNVTLTSSNGYGWYEVWWDKATPVRATNKSGTNNKVYIGTVGTAIPYETGKGVVGQHYKLALRIPGTYPDRQYTYKGKWSPDNNFG